MVFFYAIIRWVIIMKKYLAASIVVVITIGLLINIVVESMTVDPVNVLKGFGLFRYYTLQSNLIVGIYFASYLVGKWNKVELFSRFIGGVVIYVTVTFIVFALFIQPTYHPTGWNAVANILLHYLSPVLTILFISLYRKEYFFKRNDVVNWIIYPVLYLVFLVIYGSITNDYLYPFFQVENVGVIGLVIAIVLLVIFFIFLSFIFMKIVSNKEKANS